MLKASFHLPGLFEFIDFYEVFLDIYQKHPEYFYDYVEIKSIYGAPDNCLWNGGREGYGNDDPDKVLKLLNKYQIEGRLTFSNSCLNENHLKDNKCNELVKIFNNQGVIIYSDLLLEYLKKNYSFYYVSSTTKVLTDFNDLLKELNKEDFKYVVPDFRLNKEIDKFKILDNKLKNKIELLCNENCYIGCKDRRECYKSVSMKIIDENYPSFRCKANKSYSFFEAKKNPSFIFNEDIVNIYLPMGITNFKIEGRGLGSAMILEVLLYYLVKDEYELKVREDIYLDNTLDLF